MPPNCGLSIFSILLELNQSASEKRKFYLHTWAALKAHCHVSILVPQLFFEPLARTCRTHGIQAFPYLPSAAGDQRPNWWYPHEIQPIPTIFPRRIHRLFIGKYHGKYFPPKNTNQNMIGSYSQTYPFYPILDGYPLVISHGYTKLPIETGKSPQIMIFPSFFHL